MTKKAETIFAERVDKDLKKIGGWWTNIQQLSICGIPDRLGCVNGHFVALELKSDPGHSASKLQRYILKRIVNAGGIAEEVNPDNWPGVRDYIINKCGLTHLTHWMEAI